jgi:hypothetical protein
MNIEIFGSGLDALVCSKKLLEAGHHVKLFSNTEKLGGHFSGYKNSHGYFDTGMVLLENDHRSVSKTKLSQYNNEFGRSLRPYLFESYKWLEEISGGFEGEKLQTKLSTGEKISDYFIADNLAFLNYLKEDLKKDLIEKLELYLIHTSDEKKYQISKKMSDEVFNSLTIEEYYLKVFGQKFFERFFAKFLDNVAPKNFKTRARDHRKFWLPLYFPESIYFALTQNQNFKNFELAEVPFEKPQNMMICDMVHSISERTFNHPKFDFELINSFSEVTKGSQKNVQTILFIPADQLAVFLPNSNRIIELSSEIANSLESLGSTTIHIIHCCIPKNENSTVFFQENLNGLFRYSISQQKGNTLNSVASFEFNGQEDFDFRKGLATIKNLGFEVLCEGSHLAAPFRPKYLNLSISKWREIVVEFESELEKNLILGTIVNPEANNFNDNLVRGLAYALKISEEG